MARARTVLLLLVVAAATLAPAAGHARSTRPKPVFTNDCSSHELLVPMTRQQAQSYLPKGFTPTTGAADLEEQVYLSFATLQCHGPVGQELRLVVSFMHVNAPKRYAHPDTDEIFIFAVTGEGAGLDRFARALCAEDVIGEGDMRVTSSIARSDAGVGRGSTEVASEVLSASMNVATGGAPINRAGARRWIYPRGDGYGFFDEAHSLNFISLGAGNIVFTEPFLDLPPALAGGGIIDVYEQMMFTPPPTCRAR